MTGDLLLEAYPTMRVDVSVTTVHKTSPGRGKEVKMVILIDKHKKPVGFITEGHLRRLCNQHRAVIYRVFPTVAILTDKSVKEMEKLYTYQLKIDPGAKYTGLSIVCNETNEVMFFMQLKHRGEQVKHNLETRRQTRRAGAGKKDTDGVNTKQEGNTTAHVKKNGFRRVSRAQRITLSAGPASCNGG